MFQLILHRRNVQTALRFLVDFIERASIHGVPNLARSYIHWTEFVFWLGTIFLMTIAAIIMSNDLLFQYLQRNAVITSNKNYMEYTTTLPSYTICPHEVLDTDKVAEYLRFENLHCSKIVGIQLTGGNKRKSPSVVDDKTYTLFLKKLASSTIGRVHRFAKYNYDVLPNQYMELVFNLSKDYYIAAEGVRGIKIMTDLGICYTFNSKLANAASTIHWGDKGVEEALFSEHLPLQKTTNFYDDFPITLNIEHTISTGLSVYVNSPNELPTTWSRKVAQLKGKGTIWLTSELLEITDSEEFIEETTCFERQCRSMDEATLEMFPSIYSENLCLMDCRRKHTMNFCRCIPHFYNRLSTSSPHKPICGVYGLSCLNQYSKIFYKLHGNSTKSFNCSCLPNCSLVLTKATAIVLDNMDYPNEQKHFIVAKIEYPPMEQFRRSSIYAAADFAVAIGSVLSVFLGCSLLSFVDLIYYFTIRVFFFRRGYRGVVDQF